MGLTRAQVSLYQQVRSGDNSGSDRRFNTKHKRFSRGFVDMKVHGITIRYWPLKACCGITGLTQMTLRNWISNGIIAATRVYRMYVLCKPEMYVIRRISAEYRQGNLRHTVLSSEFVKALRDELQSVRYALDKCARGMPIDTREEALIVSREK